MTTTYVIQSRCFDSPIYLDRVDPEQIFFCEDGSMHALPYDDEDPFIVCVSGPRAPKLQGPITLEEYLDPPF